MILPKDKDVLKLGDKHAGRWPNGNVPYVIEGAYSKYAESTGLDGKNRPIKNHALQIQPSETSLTKLPDRLDSGQETKSRGLR